MTPLVSFLIPSRKRFNKLLKVIESIQGSCLVGQYEILVRLDHDEEDVGDKVVSLSRIEGVTSVALGDGVYVDGKLDVNKLSSLWDEPYHSAKGTWIIPHSDDIFIAPESKGWIEHLAKIPTDGFIVWPSLEKLNASEYRNHPNGCLPIVPNKSLSKIIYPPDRAGPNELRERGWKDTFIEMSIFHDRVVDETLPQSSF